MATRLMAVVLWVALFIGCGTSRVVRLDTGQSEPLEYRPPTPTSNKPVKVDAKAFEEALMQLVLNAPLSLRISQQGLLVRASYPSNDMAPQLFYTMIATGLVSWAVLAANPEPVFTKAAAITSAVLLIYLGVETFLELVDASRELKRATDKATTLEELEQAGRRFANRVGPGVSRVVVLAVTVVISHGMTGGAALLASRLSMLPSFSEAAAVGASRVGISLANVGQVSAVAVVGSTIVISLPATAVAMAAQGMGGGDAASPAVFKSWGSFSGLKNALGPAGEGKEWHHVVEQTSGNVERFGPHALHNTQNVIPLEKELHAQISAFYSRKRFIITNSESMTVREWLSTQPFEAQRQFGLQAIENIKKGIWR
jgi:hypothetical protein